MSVLNRYSNAEKYQGVLREICNCQILNDKSKPGLFLKEEILERIGWKGKVSDFTDAEKYEHMYNNGDRNKGIYFRSPRLLVLHCGFPKDTTFIENGSDKTSTIEGMYPRDSHLYDEWEQANPGKPTPYKRRRLILIFLVDKDGVAVHKKPLILSVHGGASRYFTEAYSNFIEELEATFAEYQGSKGGSGFDPKQAAAAIFTPTFDVEMYGEERKSPVANVKSWIKPTVSKIEDFFPKKDEDIDFIEQVWETIPPTVYAKGFFDQCAKEIGYHSIKEGVSLDAIPSYTTEEGSAAALSAAKDPDTGEIAF